jgi:hypothetical protein
MIGMRKSYKISVVKAEERRSLGRPRYRWENIEMSIKEIRCGIVDWSTVALSTGQWRVFVNSVLNLQVP